MLIISRWMDNCFDDEYRQALILRNPELLGLLKNCQTLKQLTIQFASQHLEDRDHAFNCSIPLKGFRDLTALELYKFYGDEDLLVKDIAGVLIECPRLKTLGLAFACDCDCDEFPEAIVLEGDCQFLENLCVQYASRRGATPLVLETLRLGLGMCLYASSSPAVGNFLTKLVNVSGLRTLHVFNGSIKYGSIDDDSQPMEIDWSLLDACKSLHQLSVTRLEDDVRLWLNNGGKSVQELMVSDHYSMYEDGLHEFDALTSHLSMLMTWEITVRKRNLASGDAWSDTDSSISDSDAIDLDEDNSAATIPELDPSTITVLDRLHDGGSHLTRLAICMDFETQWVSLTFGTHRPR